MLTQTLDSSGGKSELGLKWIIAISLLFNLLLRGAARYIFLFINSLMLIIHLPLMQVVVPANVSNLFAYMLPIVQFDFIDEDVLKRFLQFDSSIGEEQVMERFG